MKKVIVTKENYEEVMFNLLENEYPADVMENILDQIHADTFLAFEWQQWSKTVYSESTEDIKNHEAAYIESLTKPEENKGGAAIIRFMYPLSVAAGLAILFGLFLVFRPASESVLPLAHTRNNSGSVQRPAPGVGLPTAPADADDRRETRNEVTETPLNPVLVQQSPRVEVPDTHTLLPEPIRTAENDTRRVAMINDTVRMMLGLAKKQESRFRVSIVEESMDGTPPAEYALQEKRYTMADVLKQKDGISLAKFLDNPRSKIVRDKENIYIEYTAEDSSVLILTLAN